MIKFRYLLIVFFINFFLKSAYSCTTNNTGSCTGLLSVTSSGVTATNSGTITSSTTAASSTAYGIYSNSASSSLTVINSGTISVSAQPAAGAVNATDLPHAAHAIVTNASGFVLTNSGTITATTSATNGSSPTVGSRAIINNGDNAKITNTNTGTISATSSPALSPLSGSWSRRAYALENYGNNLEFTNSGILSGTSTRLHGIGFTDNGTGKIGATITNSGTISGTATEGTGTGMQLIFNNSTITNTNTGTISGSNVGISNSGTGITINNSGAITGTTRGIKNNNIINALNNSQGAGNVNGALTYEGKLPTNYNIIINSSSNYGKLSVTSGTDSLIFGIYNTSNVTSGTYQDVLTGVSRSNLSNTQLTGTYGAYNWILALNNNTNNYDLTIAASRSAYNEIVTTAKLTNTASKLETIRTNGTKNTLTNTLDNLSAAQLESAVKKIQGSSIVKTSAQSVQAQSSFKTALSTVTSPGSSSSMTNVTKTNQGSLTFADLQKNNLYAKIQSANYSDDSNFFDYKNNQVPVNALEFFKSNRNVNLVEKDDFKESGIFLRTFGSITNYAAINSDDNSYGSDSYGLLGGFQHKIDENLYQGYSLGFSKSKLTLDAGEGNTKTNTIHANVYRKMDEKEYGVTASLGGYVSFIDNVRNISETSEILKSSPTNGGLDFSVQYVKKMELLGLNFYPSASLTTTYGIVKNYKETGGSGSALEIKSHNVLAIKPEIGFTLENNFIQTDKITEGANFSLFANRQQYLDGHTNTSSMIGENSWSASTLPKTKDDFLTAGIGYVAKNIDEKSDLNFNFFYTQSTNNSLNSSLFSISYNKTF
jgi:hypothetical protein